MNVLRAWRQMSDTTEYLLSSPQNRERLMASMDAVRAGRIIARDFTELTLDTELQLPPSDVSRVGED